MSSIADCPRVLPSPIIGTAGVDVIEVVAIEIAERLGGLSTEEFHGQPLDCAHVDKRWAWRRVLQVLARHLCGIIFQGYFGFFLAIFFLLLISLCSRWLYRS